MLDDVEVCRVIYNVALTTGRPPGVDAIASALGASVDDVRASMQRLADAHVLVLDDVSGEILMAMPFSAVPTSFAVTYGDGIRAWGNCIWDSLGIPIMARRDGIIETACGCCGSPMSLHVEGGALRERNAAVVHYAIPAREWWNDVVFT